jgi:DUF1365 family protein
LVPFAAVLLVLAYPREAQAYLDAGSASMIFQALIASILGAAVVVRIYWRRIKSYFRGTREPTEDPQNEDDES